MGYYFDWTMIVLIPALLLTMYAQTKIQSAYTQYSKIRAQKGLTGAQVARMILNENGLSDVQIELIGGKLSDHYDPRTRVLRLSNGVYNGNSIASNAIAAHEVGHAIQHARAYMPLKIRNAIVPVVNIASQAATPLIFIGLFFAQFQGLLSIGIILFSGSVLFQLVTLPVEFDASSRAIKQLADGGILVGTEIEEGKRVLSAAALTYVAAAAAAVSQLMRLLLIRDSRNNRN